IILISLSATLLPLPPRFPYTTLFRSSSSSRYSALASAASTASGSSVGSPSMTHPFASVYPSAHQPSPMLRCGRPLSAAFIPLVRSEEHTSELQSRFDLVCRLLLEKKN